MKNAKRFAAVLLTVVLVAGMLTGCKDALAQAVRKVLGTSSQAEEADTTRWAEATADPLMIEGIADPSAKYDSAITNGRLNVVFNGIWSRKTSYFTAPNGSITLTGCGTAEACSALRWQCGKSWTAERSMWGRAPIISRPTAPTTAAPLPGWTRRLPTGSPSRMTPAGIICTVWSRQRE